MSFPVRPIDDYCPDLGTCPDCGGKVCLSCGGDSSPVTCAGEIHCTACAAECPFCGGVA